MENNLPMVAKRFWNIMRVVYYILRKEISKRKLMLDLNLVMKRGKIAGKAIGNLMFHHHHFNSNRRTSARHLSFSAPTGYEFSCENSPAFPFQLTKRRNNHGGGNHHSYSHFFSCAHSPVLEDDEGLTANAVKQVMEMFDSGDKTESAYEASPAFPGYGRSPAKVRQLRITDSPFPLSNVDDDHEVDFAAEEFIRKFYNNLNRQQLMASPKPW